MNSVSVGSRSSSRLMTYGREEAVSFKVSSRRCSLRSRALTTARPRGPACRREPERLSLTGNPPEAGVAPQVVPNRIEA